MIFVNRLTFQVILLNMTKFMVANQLGFFLQIHYNFSLTAFSYDIELQIRLSSFLLFLFDNVVLLTFVSAVYLNILFLL